MTFIRRMLAATLIATATTSSAWAQGTPNWRPSKPVRIVVPIVGSTNDVLARLIAPELQKAFGQPFVVENKPGAGGNIGTDFVAKAAPDGYTVLISIDTVFTVNPHIYKGLPFKPTDFTQVNPHINRVLVTRALGLLAVLGVAFSFGIPMAFAAVRAEVPALAWWLLIGNLFWVLAYDTEYAMVDRDDDLLIGMKTSAITLGRFDVAGVMLSYLIFISIWAVALYGRAQSAIFSIAIGLALLQALWHGWLIRKRERDGCFKAFRLNHWLGFTVFAGVALSYELR